VRPKWMISESIRRRGIIVGEVSYKGTVNLSNPRAIFAGSPPRFTRSRVTYEAYVVRRTSTRPQVDSAIHTLTLRLQWDSWAVTGDGFAPVTVTAQDLRSRQTRQARGWGLLPGHQWGPTTGHQWGLFHFMAMDKPFGNRDLDRHQRRGAQGPGARISSE